MTINIFPTVQVYMQKVSRTCNPLPTPFYLNVHPFMQFSYTLHIMMQISTQYITKHHIILHKNTPYPVVAMCLLEKPF